jgi:hypothetical protein
MEAIRPGNNGAMPGSPPRRLRMLFGIGGGVVDRLHYLRLPATEVQFGRRADRASVGQVGAIVYADNKRAEMWGNLRGWVRTGAIDCRDPVDQARHVHAAARLMTAFQDGAATLAKLRHGGRQQVTVVRQHVQVAGGQVAVAGAVQGGYGAGEG